MQASRDGAPFGLEGVRAAFASGPADAEGAVHALAAAVLGHADGELDDDLAAVVLRPVE